MPACVRLRTRSFSKIAVTCAFTVRSWIESRSAICLSSSPSASRASTRDCCSVNRASRPARFGEALTHDAPPTHRPLLEVKHLVTRFPVKKGVLQRHVANVHAVDDVSLAIGAGETLALVGESGCGKSTTGRSVLRLVEPKSGSVTLEGDELTRLSGDALRKKRRDMQIIFQDPYAALDPRLTAFEQVAEPLVIHGVEAGSALRDRVVGLIRRVGLSDEQLERYPHEFSGGQRQRLCIARALTLSPKLIVADEPVSALDVSIQAQVVNLMIELQQELGLSYLFISHDMAWWSGSAIASR